MSDEKKDEPSGESVWEDVSNHEQDANEMMDKLKEHILSGEKSERLALKESLVRAWVLLYNKDVLTDGIIERLMLKVARQ